MTEQGPRFADVYVELNQPGGIKPAMVRRVFDAILGGLWTPAQVAGFLVALRMSGESAPVIAAAAESLRSAMLPLEHGFDRLLDTCGTGGDGHGTLNLSTGAAIIAAAAGVPVAKHGNRAASSKAGSADVLEALEIPIDLTPKAAGVVLADVKITFMMAPTHHPAMRHAGPARRELGIRTIFNCVAPLANPARVTHQLLGACEDSLRHVLAEALLTIGSERAWVVRGCDGLDEVSPCGVTRVTQLSEGRFSDFEVSPEDFGLARLSPEAVRGGAPAENAAVLASVLAGEAHPSRDAFLLNAAAALVVADGMEPKAAADRARQAVDSGAAMRLVQSWRQAAQRARAETG